MDRLRLWQTVKDKNNIKPELQEYRKKWKELHPDYDHILTDDADNRKLVSKYFPEYLTFYDGLTFNIERVDFVRFVMMWIGGVYADMDTYPLKNIDAFVNTSKIVFGCEPQEHAQTIYNKEKVICNALMISPPKQNFWKKIMKFIVNNYEYNFKPVETTGPIAITKFYENFPDEWSDVIITDPCIFYPMKSDNTISDRCKKGESYVVHVWDNSWVPKAWYKDPIVWNKRYWAGGVCVIIMLLIILYIYMNKMR
ncbi:glycosyltransferase [bacterium]|nr:glycosyltransferase [bacterium]